MEGFSEALQEPFSVRFSEQHLMQVFDALAAESCVRLFHPRGASLVKRASLMNENWQLFILIDVQTRRPSKCAYDCQASESTFGFLQQVDVYSLIQVLHLSVSQSDWLSHFSLFWENVRFVWQDDVSVSFETLLIYLWRDWIGFHIQQLLIIK